MWHVRSLLHNLYRLFRYSHGDLARSVAALYFPTRSRFALHRVNCGQRALKDGLLQ